MTAEHGNEGGKGSTDNRQQSIGERLTAAREQRKLAIEKVASELNLDADIILALERDEKGSLPAPIFVQGYLRSYARLVGLPEEELVKDYTLHAGELPPLHVVDVNAAQPVLRLPSGKLLRNVISVLLVTIIIWLAYPAVEKLVTSRGQTTQGPASDHLELPPANQPVE